MDRTIPHSHDAEEGVLACIMLDPNQTLTELAGKFDPESFYDLRLRTIYQEMESMYNSREHIDSITLQQRLKDKNLLEQVGGLSYVVSLPDKSPSAANLPHYTEIVSEKLVLRKLISNCSTMADKAYSHTGDVEEILSEFEREALKIRPNKGEESQGIKSHTQSALDRINQIFQLGGKIGGITTGLTDLDKQTDGLHGGEMVVVAGFPSTGKTALALGMAVANAMNRVPVAVASCEMQPSELTVRAICSEARVNLFDVRDGIANEGDFNRMGMAAVKISNLPLHLENTNGYTIERLQAWMRRAVQKHGIKLLVVDYLQLLSCAKTDSREQEVASVSRGLKAIAMEHNIPVIALSQLNDDGRLRESRAIGQDADSVWKLENDGDKVPHEQPIKLHIDKNRNGPVGSVPLLFRKQFTRFENAAKISEQDVYTPYKE
jgi:replicative DNA helicase